MKAWVIDKVSDLRKDNNPLKQVEIPKPEPQNGEIVIKVSVCGVCHTEIDEIEGRTPPPGYPVVPAIFLVVILFMTVFAFKQWPKPSMYSLGSILAGIPVYYIWSFLRHHKT